jgi:hypothetical protein
MAHAQRDRCGALVSHDSTPLELTLEFARTEAAGDPYAFRFQAQTYNVRWENGTYAEAEFTWDAAGGAVPAVEHLDAIRRAAVEGHHPFDEDRDVIACVSTSSLREALAGSPVARTKYETCLRDPIGFAAAPR